jgi:hypothetical protein
MPLILGGTVLNQNPATGSLYLLAPYECGYQLKVINAISAQTPGACNGRGAQDQEPPFAELKSQTHRDYILCGRRCRLMCLLSATTVHNLNRELADVGRGACPLHNRAALRGDRSCVSAPAA